MKSHDGWKGGKGEKVKGWKGEKMANAVQRWKGKNEKVKGWKSEKMANAVQKQNGGKYTHTQFIWFNAIA